jgi:protein TonB
VFEGFEGGGDRQSRKRFAVSSGASIACCVLLIGVIVALASKPRAKKQKPPPVKVVFHAPRKPPPPPAPKPKPRPKRAAAKSAKKAAGPSAAPTQRPEGALPEADASAFQGGNFGGIAWGEEGKTGLGGGALGDARKSKPPPPPSVRGVGARPVDEAERMTPPRPAAGNRLPAYPEDMRKKGVEALVILRVLVDEDGTVKDIDVVQGEEPFLGAALAVVKTYRYEPARLDGRATAVHRLIRVPFRLRT